MVSYFSVFFVMEAGEAVMSPISFELAPTVSSSALLGVVSGDSACALSRDKSAAIFSMNRRDAEVKLASTATPSSK